MRKVSSLVLACTWLGAVVLAAAGPAAFVEKAILVTVLDKENVPIRDLAPAEFSVSEDGKRREVTGAALSTEPLFVSLLIDTSRPQEGDDARVRDLRTSLTTFVKAIHAVSPTAQIAITTVGGASVPIKNFTNQTNELERITGAMIPDLQSTTVVLEALIDAARGLEDKKSPRRAIVTLDFASREGSTVEPTTVIEQVFKAGASVWAVSIHGAMGGTAPRRDTTLNHLTKNTGGIRATALLPTALEGIMKNLANSLTAQYEVTYMRPDGSAPPKSIVPSAKRGAKFLLSPYIQSTGG
jgi:hypothetical protein